MRTAYRILKFWFKITRQKIKLRVLKTWYIRRLQNG